jgi:hypothetical protein
LSICHFLSWCWIISCSCTSSLMFAIDVTYFHIYMKYVSSVCCGLVVLDYNVDVWRGEEIKTLSPSFNTINFQDIKYIDVKCRCACHCQRLMIRLRHQYYCSRERRIVEDTMLANSLPFNEWSLRIFKIFYLAYKVYIHVCQLLSLHDSSRKENAHYQKKKSNINNGF